jgi:hypothetical protein
MLSERHYEFNVHTSRKIRRVPCNFNCVHHFDIDGGIFTGFFSRKRGFLKGCMCRLQQVYSKGKRIMK